MYTTSSLTTASDCDALLSMAGKDKLGYEYKLTSINYQQNVKSFSAQEIQAEKQVLEAEIQALTDIIAALPEGAYRTDQETKKMRKELQLRGLNTRNTNQGPVSLLDQQLEQKRIAAAHAETLAFIEAITARKQQLAD